VRQPPQSIEPTQLAARYSASLIKPLIPNRWWRLLLFSFLVYCPASLPSIMVLRVYREYVYLSLLVFIVAFSIGLFLRIQEKLLTVFLWALGLGLSMGAFLIAREEGIWIYPALLILFSICIFLVWKKKLNRKWLRSCLILLPILLWYIPTIIVSATNYQNYDFWGTSEQLDPDFNRVLNTLARIKTSTWSPHVHIPQEAFQKAYQVSPTLKILQKYIDNLTPGWLMISNDAYGLEPDWYKQQYPGETSEIGSGHSLWLLRDAVFNAGYYSSGKFPHALYKQIADELESACIEGRLDCNASISLPFIGNFDQRELPLFFRYFADDGLSYLKLDPIAPINLDVRSWSHFLNDDYKYFSQLTNDSLQGVVNYFDSNEDYFVVGNSLDIRLKMILYKEIINQFIVQIYRWVTLPLFIISIITWIFSIFWAIKSKSLSDHSEFLIISTFIFGTFFSRFVTLVIVDATTATRGYVYLQSSYALLYAFVFLAIFTYYTNYAKSWKNK